MPARRQHTRPEAPRRLHTADLAGLHELGERFGVRPHAVSNWTVRFADFPAPVRTLGQGAVYSMADVVAWYGTRWEVPA